MKRKAIKTLVKVNVVGSLNSWNQLFNNIPAKFLIEKIWEKILNTPILDVSLDLIEEI